MDSESEPPTDNAMMVAVTLTPLGLSESSELRKFSLSKERRQVDVGRASKNPRRGNQAQSDNAIFKCPIMSRSHACFTASPVFKTLYIRDLGSTHGTFVGEKNVPVGSVAIVPSGVTVTFGVKVTNGELVYPAKAFRVEYLWQPRQESDTPANTSRIFRVPDSDNEGEVISVHSRQSSVELIDSKICKTTYSVPSVSDYDSNPDDFEGHLEEHSPVRSHDNQESAVTTPEQHDARASNDTTHSERVKTKTIDSDLEDPKLQCLIGRVVSQGSSQKDPINLDDKNAHDQGNAHLAINLHEPWISEAVDVYETESEEGGPEVLPIQPISKRSDIADLLNDKPVPASLNPAEDVVDADGPASDSNNPEKSRFERILRETQRAFVQNEITVETNGLSESGPSNSLGTFNPFSLNVDKSTINGTKAATTGFYEDGEEEDEDDEDEDDEDEDDEDDESDEMDADFSVDFDQADGSKRSAVPESTVEKPQVSLRLPTVFSLTEVDDVHEPMLPNDALMQRATSPSDAALARTSTNMGYMPSLSSILPHDVHAPSLYSQPNTRHWNSPFVSGNPLLRNTPLTSFNIQYNTGPFSFNTVDGPSSSPDLATQGPDVIMHHGRHEYPSVFPNYRVPSAEAQISDAPLPKTSEDTSSKLQISNLVSSYYTEPLHSTKRKAAEMSADSEHAGIIPALSQETPLPDAQPRDVSLVPESSTSLGQTIEPNISSIASVITPERSSADEPSRKKIKMSSAASGIGKFLFGVGVGAVGLAAAFLATIPADVQEEVRLDL